MAIQWDRDPDAYRGKGTVYIYLDSGDLEIKKTWQVYWDATPDETPRPVESGGSFEALDEALAWAAPRTSRMIIDRYGTRFLAGAEPTSSDVEAIEDPAALGGFTYLSQKLMSALRPDPPTVPTELRALAVLHDGREFDVWLESQTGEVWQANGSVLIPFGSDDVARLVRPID